MIDPARYRDDDNDTQRTHDQPVHSRVRQRFRHAVQGFDGVVLERLERIKSTDAKKRKHAADVLGNVGPVDPRAVPALIEAVKDKDAKVRDAAVLGLSKIGEPAAAAESVLQEALKDKDATVRTHAASALERIRRAK